LEEKNMAASATPTQKLVSDFTADEIALVAMIRTAKANIAAQLTPVAGVVKADATELVADATAVGSALHTALQGALKGI
jgi:hypothetical protein